MAAPFASGIAALLYGEIGSGDPAAVAEVQSLVTAGALPLTSVDPTYSSALGAGRVSASGSLDALDGEPEIRRTVSR